MLCKVCRHELTDDNWYACSRESNNYTCKTCTTARSLKNYYDNHEERKAYMREYNKGKRKPRVRKVKEESPSTIVKREKQVNTRALAHAEYMREYYKVKVRPVKRPHLTKDDEIPAWLKDRIKK